MSFLGRAREAILGMAPKTVEPRYYDVTCPEGHLLRGERQESYQALRCPACGEGVFVLPRGGLPAPPRPATKAAARTDARRAERAPEQDGPEELIDPPAAPELTPDAVASREADWVEPVVGPDDMPQPRDQRPSKKRASAQHPRPDRGAATANPTAPEHARPSAGRPVPAPVAAAVARRSIGERLHRNRHALAFAGVLVLVLGTLWLVRDRERRKTLPGLIAKGRTEGLRALEEGRFDTARDLLTPAARALDELGASGIEGADEIRQGALEAAILTDRVSDTLETILDDLARRPKSDRDSEFRKLYRGRSIIIDDRFERNESNGIYESDYRIGIAASPKPRIARIDYKGFKLIDGLKPESGRRLVLGARLAGLVRDEAEEVWRFTLEPESGVIMSWKALEALDPSAWKDAPAAEASFVPRALGGALAIPIRLVRFATASVVVADDAPVVDSRLLMAKPREWLGKEAILDERVKFFRPHPGRGFDELAPAGDPALTCLIPEASRPEKPPRESTVRGKGMLRKTSDGKYVFAFDTFELLPVDRVRLERGLAILPPREYSRRKAWGEWAVRRGEIYGDDELRELGKTIESEALAYESVDREVADRSALLLSLAKQAADDRLDPQVVGALVHAAMRLELKKSPDAAELKRLADLAEGYLPQARALPKASRELEKWRDAYQVDPADAYRAAPKGVRAEWDHELFADIYEAYFKAAAASDPARSVELAEEAKRILPERPGLEADLRNRAVDAGLKNIAKLRESEVRDLAKSMGKLPGGENRVKDLYRRWLDDLRLRRLAANDAEGRVTLAGQYADLLGDRVTAAALLREAEALDPGSELVAEGYRRLGFRKSKGTWVDPQAAEADQAPGPAARARDRSDLRGLTRDEVIARMGGKPDRIVRVVTQSEIVEQWIYRGAKTNQYLNFVRTPVDPNPTVSSSFKQP